MDGETVLGCYKIERKIGEGFVVHSCLSCSGFSEVYLATDLESSEPVALKKLKKKQPGDGLEENQKVLKSCSSKFIVRYYDAKRDGQDSWVDQQGLH